MTAPRSVLYVANSSKIGGGNRSMIDLISGLDRRRFRPFLAAPRTGPLVDWASEAAVPCTIVEGDDLSGRSTMARRGARLASLAMRRQAHVVHAMAPTCYRGAALAGLLAGAVRVCHLGFPPADGELDWSFWSGPEAVVGCYTQQAADVARDMARINPRCRVVAVPNGIDLRRFSPRSEQPAAIRASLGLGSAPLVLIVGHLSEVKGYPTFLEAAAEIVREVPDCQFAALGGETLVDGYQRQLEHMAGSLGLRGRVHFLGWRNDVADVLQAADIVALPSRAEGLPLAILEAMACGRPVVATPVGGVPDAVVEGVTGHLVPPDDPRRLASALVRMLRDPDYARRLGAQARAHVEARFSVEGFVAGIEALYDELTSTRRAMPFRRASVL